MRLFAPILALSFARLFAPTVHAGLTEACSVAGCSPISPTIVASLAVTIGNMLIYTASGLCVLFIVYGGVLITFSLGDDGRFQKGKNSILYAMFGFGCALASQSALAFVASLGAFSSTYTIAGNPIVTAITNASELMIDAFNSIFIVAIVIGGIQMVMARGASDKFDSARRTVMYAVGGALVVNLAKILTLFLFSLGL